MTKRLMRWLGVVLALMITGGFLIWRHYQQGDLSGIWRSPALEKALQTEVLADFQSDTVDGVTLDIEKMLVDPVVQLDIDGQEGQATMSYRIDKTVMLEAYQDLIDQQYKAMLADLEKSAQAAGLAKEEALKQVYGNDYEKTIRAMFPKTADFEKDLDKQFEQIAAADGQDYDHQTGILSYRFDFTVNPLWRQVTASKEATGGALPVQLGSYKISGDTLVFDGDEVYTFNKE